MKGIIMVTVLVVMMAMSGMAAAEVQENWPLGDTNTYSGTYILVDFDGGVCKDIITYPTDKIVFENDGSNPWIYACKNCTPTLLNIYDPVNNEDGRYMANGDCAAWCNTPGHYGNISFDHDVGHVSVLVSTFSGLQMDAYNESGVLVATSGRANSTLGSRSYVGGRWVFDDPIPPKVFTRVSVDRQSCDISYVCIHDGGNYWMIDDLVVGYEPVCTEIVINTTGSDTTVCFGMTINFTAECTDQYGYDMDCPVLNWTSNDDRVGTMDGSVFTADKKGNTTIEASFGDDVTSNLIDITVVPGQKMLAHCQKFIHGQGDDHWNESAYTNKTHPCNQTLYNQTV